MGWRCGNYKKCFPQIDKNDKQIQAELTWIVAKDVMKNRELRELYFQKYGVKYKVRKEKGEIHNAKTDKSICSINKGNT